MTFHTPNIPAHNIALLLDVDGTLVEIAPTPDAVKVSSELRDILQLAAARENGALALISGRSIAELDKLFAPCLFAAAGQHGMERRDACGLFVRPHINSAPLLPVRAALSALQEQNPGLLLEDKGSALAMHYRLAPDCEALVYERMNALAEPLHKQFSLRSGKCVLELAPRGFSKRTAIEAFMREAPFAGRVPVFVGDDVTDEDGFKAVNELGGISIRVGNADQSAANYSFESVAVVIDWLRGLIANLSKI